MGRTANVNTPKWNPQVRELYRNSDNMSTDQLKQKIRELESTMPQGLFRLGNKDQRGMELLDQLRENIRSKEQGAIQGELLQNQRDYQKEKGRKDFQRNLKLQAPAYEAQTDTARIKTQGQIEATDLEGKYGLQQTELANDGRIKVAEIGAGADRYLADTRRDINEYSTDAQKAWNMDANQAQRDVAITRADAERYAAQARANALMDQARQQRAASQLESFLGNVGRANITI